MNMKRLILLTFAVLTVICAQAQMTYGADWLDVSPKESEELLWAMVKNKTGLYLNEWGFLKDNRLTSPQDWKDKGQVWILTADKMGHLNTDDGNCFYDARISDGRVNLTHQSKLIDKKEVSTNPSYKGWFKIIAIDPQDGTFLTLDNWGVYRIFQLFPISDLMDKL